MNAEQVKGWFSAAREVVGFIRDLIATKKEIRELKEAKEGKEEKKENVEK